MISLQRVIAIFQSADSDGNTGGASGIAIMMDSIVDKLVLQNVRLVPSCAQVIASRTVRNGNADTIDVCTGTAVV